MTWRGFPLLIVCMLSWLAGCTTPSNGIGKMILHDNSLYLCGWDRVRRLNLADNSEESYPIRCGNLFQAHNGWIWVDTSPQPKVFDGNQWRDVDVPRGGAIAFTEGRDGLIWAASTLLSSNDPATGQSAIIVPQIEVPPATPAPVVGEWAVSLPSPGAIGPVFEAADGALWYNQQFDGIVRWDRATGEKELWGPDDGFQGWSPIPAKFIQARDNDIWLGLIHRGVYRWHDRQWQTWLLPNEAMNDPGDSRFSYCPNHTSSCYHKEQGDFTVMDMLEDHEGKVWVAFNRAGLAKWSGSDWTVISGFEFPASPTALFEDSSNAIWIGSRQRSVAKFQNGQLREYPQIELITFVETPNHRLFGGGSKGLFLYNRDKDLWEPYP